MLHPAIQSKRLLFCDGDGTLWVGQSPISGVREALEILQKHLEILFLTNNSTKSRAQHARKFAKITGFGISVENIISVSWATARYLRQRIPPSGPLYVIGEYGLFNELEIQGYEFVDGSDPSAVAAVVVGLDRQFTFDKLKRAQRAILRGAPLFGTNPDPDYPGNHGRAPGAGSLLAAIETACARRADSIIGKPSPIFLQQAIEERNLRVSEAALVGDRMSTDIACARDAGVTAIRVRTGIEEEGPFSFKPDVDLNSFADLVIHDLVQQSAD